MLKLFLTNNLHSDTYGGLWFCSWPTLLFVTRLSSSSLK